MVLCRAVRCGHRATPGYAVQIPDYRFDSDYMSIFSMEHPPTIESITTRCNLLFYMSAIEHMAQDAAPDPGESDRRCYCVENCADSAGRQTRSAAGRKIARSSVAGATAWIAREMCANEQSRRGQGRRLLP